MGWYRSGCRVCWKWFGGWRLRDLGDADGRYGGTGEEEGDGGLV